MSNRGEAGAFLNTTPEISSNSSFWAAHRKIIILALVALVVLVAVVIGTIVAVTLSKETVMKDEPDCPDDFFGLDGTTECYKILKEYESLGNWTEARESCRDLGLSLAQPPQNSAAALRKFIGDKYGDPTYVWIGARRETVGSEVLWQHHQGDLTTNDNSSSSSSSLVIPGNSSLWYPGFGPEDDISPDCVLLLVGWWAFDYYPDKPYVLWSCGRQEYPLCQDFNLGLE